MALRLLGSPPDRVGQVQALAGDIILCSWARASTLTVPLSTQMLKWVLANLMLGTGEGPCEGLASHPWEVEILLVATETGRRIRNDQIWA